MTTSFYPPFHIGGDAIHVKYLAEELVKAGHEVHVLHSMDAYNFKRKENRTPQKSRVIVHTMKSPIGKLEPILNYCFGTQKYTMNFFKNLVEKEKFDVVHHHNISLLGYDILKKIGNYTNLYTAHDYWLVCHKYDLTRNDKLCIKKECFSCCLKQRKIYQLFRHLNNFRECLDDIDTIIAPSEFMAEVLRNEFKNVKVINNFIPEYNIKANLEKTEDYFIYAGVLTKLKGIINLSKVFSEIDKVLMIAGTGELENYLRELKLKNVKLLGFIPHNELFPLIISAKALIIPSVWPENNPLIALESLSLGTPVIGSDAGGIPEIVGKVDENLIFDKNKPDELKNIIANFDAGKYPKETIKKIYEDNFSKENFLKKYNKLLVKK